MSIKFFMFLVLGLIIFGIIISTGYRILAPAASLMPAGEDVALTELISTCNSKLRVYNQLKNDENKRDLCCASSDLNSDGVISSNEYCSRACSNCSVGLLTVTTICAEYISRTRTC